jgi:PIN domain nuclease of toxin-antitoxin system
MPLSTWIGLNIGIMIFLDTHVLVWLYGGIPDPFSEQAKRELQNSDLVISPIVLLELQYLHEAKKIHKNGDVIFSALQKTTGIRMMEHDWEEVMRTALPLAWTRDPFDRIIVAHAVHHKAKLLTKDRQIQRHYAGAVW